MPSQTRVPIAFTDANFARDNQSFATMLTKTAIENVVDAQVNPTAPTI